jgi:hypothetical protein
MTPQIVLLVSVFLTRLLFYVVCRLMVRSWFVAAGGGGESTGMAGFGQIVPEGNIVAVAGSCSGCRDLKFKSGALNIDGQVRTTIADERRSGAVVLGFQN